jgi:hypothetical protein
MKPSGIDARVIIVARISNENSTDLPRSKVMSTAIL